MSLTSHDSMSITDDWSDRAVYPYSIEEIYPSSTVRMKEKTAGIVTELQAVYPNIQLCTS